MKLVMLGFVLAFGINAQAAPKTSPAKSSSAKSPAAKAKTDSVVAEISFATKTLSHKYSLVRKVGKSQTFQLVFNENKKKSRAKNLSVIEAEDFKNAAVRIIWDSEYRKPASVKACTQYATISAGLDKTAVCKENRKATAITYGLLNSLARHF